MITNNDLKYLRLAETVGEYSDYNRIHIGSCIIKKHSVISTGCNKTKSHPIQNKYNNALEYAKKKDCLHAEIDALIKAGKEAKGSTMYVFRRGLDNIYRNCKPCPACMKMITDYGIKRIVYTIENGIKEIILR